MFRDYIFSEERMKWVRKNVSGGCPFCRIAKERVGSKGMKLYQNESMMVIMNIFPATTGHLQVVPLRHVVHLNELNSDEYSEFCLMIKKSMLLLDKTMKPLGYNMGMNIGGNPAGGSILHLHAQIIPRYERDFGFPEVACGTKILPQRLETTYKKLMKNVSVLS